MSFARTVSIGTAVGWARGVESRVYQGFIELDGSHVGAAAEMLARAFEDDPLGVYLFPDPSARRKVLPLMYRSMVEVALARGSVYATSERLEGIFWVTPAPDLSPGDRSHTRSRGRARRRASTLAIIRAIARAVTMLWQLPTVSTVRRGLRLGRGASAMGPYSRAHAGCMRLNVVAVAAAYRGQGLGGRMVRAVCREADRTGACCVLDTESEANVRMYEHLGFKLDVKVEAVPGELSFNLMSYDPAGRGPKLV